MKKKILIGIVVALAVLIGINVSNAQDTTAFTEVDILCENIQCVSPLICKNGQCIQPPSEQVKTKNYNINSDNYNYIFVFKDYPSKSITVPKYLFGSTDPNSLNGEFDPYRNSIIFTVDTRGKGNQLGKGIWEITPLGQGKGYKYTLYDKENKEQQVFELVQSGGNTILIDNLESGEGYILDAQGNEMKWLGKVGACDNGQTINCYSTTNPDRPIIFTECGKGTACSERSGLLTWLREDSCYYNGKQLQYDSKTCSLLTKNAAGEAEALLVDPDGKTTTVTFKCTKEATSYDECSCSIENNEICNKVKSLKRTDDVKKGFTTGAEMAGNVGQFIELGRNYGWWKTSEDFLIFENLFEKSVLLRSILEPERAICELNVGISDLLTEGFLPTVDGKSGADIQAERYLFKKINTTTGREKESYYRYKVTFDVNGAYILKYSPVDSSGKPIYEYKTSFTVYLDDTNITGKIELSNKETYSYGTTTVGHPLMIKSNKYFKKACIKFHDIDDLEANVQGYLRENNNEVCNDVEDAYVPSLSEIKMEREEEKEGGGGGGGGEGGYSIPSVEVEV